MKKFTFLLTLALCGALLATSCSKDDDDSGKGEGETVLPEDSLTKTATAYGVATIDPELGFGNKATYAWTMESSDSELYSLTDDKAEKALLLTSAAGTYNLKLTAMKGGDTYIRHIAVTVKAPSKAPSPYIAKVFDFLPAPGQFINTMPEYKAGDTKAAIITKVEGYINNKKNGSPISLGGFGGYVVFGFDHTIANVTGKRDLRILGNAFANGSEPAIIMVAYDANGNGQPDADEWYEIAGSEYNAALTVKNYSITYHRPQAETQPAPDEEAPSLVYVRNYIRWEDNQNQSGYLIKNQYHTANSYYPGWVTEDQITFTGTRLAPNGVEEYDDTYDSIIWKLKAYGRGYADNALNTDDDSAIDIDWAVNAQGQKVSLPGIDFVKVYGGVRQECGWIGENSSEISGAYDLHLAGESIATAK